MKADPFAQLKLLDVAELDTRGDRLRHRLSTLPEVADIAAVEGQRRVRSDQARDAQIRVDDLGADQRKYETEIEQVKARRTRDSERMETGQISDPKALGRMQEEMVSLERRISTLEDEELEILEQLEEAQRELSTHQEAVAGFDARLSELEASRQEKTGELETELGQVVAERARVIEDLPEDLLALYDKLRAQKGGPGAALLRARSCGGCQLGLDNAELAQIKATPVDVVVRCEECSRILVRTGESGL